MIYLDNQSTTQIDPLVMESMIPYFSTVFGNPHADEHIFGWQAHSALEQSRRNVAELIGADKNNVIFTSGATESVSLAILGLAQLPHVENRRKIVTLTTEHSCVLESCKQAEHLGYEVVFLPVNSDGLVDLDLLKENVDNRTLMVSIMLANNEIGVIQPLKEIVSICHKVGSFCHTDATQAVGKIPVNVKRLGVDMLSASAHKVYGPKGVGLLYLTKYIEKRLQPLTYGGGQEKGIRPGTVSVPLAVGFGTAAKIAKKQMKNESKRISHLRDLFLNRLREKIPDLMIIGNMEKRLPGNLSLVFPNISGNSLVKLLGEHLAVSTGSACSSSSLEPSHVIKALELGEDVSRSALRVSIGRFNTEEEIQKAADWFLSVVKRGEIGNNK